MKLSTNFFHLAKSHGRACLLAASCFACAAHAQVTVTVIHPFDGLPGLNAGSLRDAIEQVNANNGGTINFNIDPKIFGPGPWTIKLLTPLETIKHSTTINGYSQPGSYDSPGPGLETILIEIDGQFSIIPTGIISPTLFFYPTAINSRVMGLSLTGNNAVQLMVTSSNTLVRGNYLGIRADGETVAGSGWGAAILVCEKSRFEENLIASQRVGLAIDGSNHKVDNNWFGLSTWGKALPSRFGQPAIAAAAVGINDPSPHFEPAIQRLFFGIRNSTFTNNMIVNTDAEAFFVQGMNNADGTLPSGLQESFGNEFSHNFIGVDLWNSTAEGNVRLAMRIYGGARNNRIVDNFIARSQLGIILGWGRRNSFAGVANTIRRNTLEVADEEPGSPALVKPIVLDAINNLPVANDAGDVDTGPNNFQNKPELSFASSNGYVEGAFNGATNRKFIIDFYRSKKCDTTGYGAGEQYLDQATITTDASGKASFSTTVGNLPLGGLQRTDVITATATALEIDANGAEIETDTSEFSGCQSISFPLATTTTVAALPTHAHARDQSLQLVAKLSNANSTPVNGSVEFNLISESGTRRLGVVQLQGNQAVLSNPDGVLANAGRYQIVANYLGDRIHRASSATSNPVVVFRPPSALSIVATTSLLRFGLSGMRYESLSAGNWSPVNLPGGLSVLDVAAYGNSRLDGFLTKDQNDRFNIVDSAGIATPVGSAAFSARDQLEDFAGFDLDYRMDALVLRNNKWQITLCAFDTDGCERTTMLNVNLEYRARTGDFNGDGSMDILWSDSFGRGREIWLMQGANLISQKQITGPMNYKAVATGDFDGDGYEDIVWHNPAGSDVLVWFMDRGALRETANIYMRGMDIQSRGPAYFALSGASTFGKASLLWRDGQSGEVFEWSDIQSNNGALTYMQRSIFTDPSYDLVPTR